MDNTKFEQMDLVEVERRARELRAQALADGARALRDWVAARLHLGGRTA